MDYTVHGILQARILEWVALPFYRGSSQPRNQTQVSCTAGRFFRSELREKPQISSIAQSCLTFCDAMDCSTARLPCPSPTTGAYSNSCLTRQWCIQPSHPLLLPSMFPSIRIFSNKWALHIRWPMYWSFSFSISPSNEYSGQFPLGWTGWISLQSKGLSRVFSNTTVQKHQLFTVYFIIVCVC